MFVNIPDNAVICINKDITKNYIFPQIESIPCYIIDCSYNWKKNQKKIIDESKQCVENCEKNSLYKFEYNRKCFKSCPYGITENNECKCEVNWRNVFYVRLNL